MQSIIFDTHAHYDTERFDADRDELLSSLPSLGVAAAVNCGTDIASSRRSVELAERYDYFYAACGIYPHDWDGGRVCSAEESISLLRDMAAHAKVVAIGEIGLDYRYDGTPRGEQMDIFIRQLELAKSLGLPVILHDGDAHGDMMQILREMRPRGVLHCFSGSLEMMREAVRMGLYIGIGGAVTFKNSLKRVAAAREVPLDRLVFETDAPYMAPVPLRGRRCDSSMISFTAEKVAELRGMDRDELLGAAAENACRLFGISM